MAEHRSKEHLHDDCPAVALQLYDILAGERRRCREIDRQPIINGVIVFTAERCVGSKPRLQCAPGDLLTNGSRRRSGNPDDADPALAGRGCDRSDGVYIDTTRFSVWQAGRPPSS
jgi:hypothetical protein